VFAGSAERVVRGAGRESVDQARRSTHRLEEPDTLNPVVGGGLAIDSDLAMLWGGFFFNYDDRNRYVPELALEVPTLGNGGIARDGLTITYRLRPGVAWQDGAPFDARDVVFTWRAIVNPKNNVPSTAGYDLIRTIDVPDPHTVRVHLKRPWSPFVATFFNQSQQPYPVLPAHLLAKYPDLNRVPFNALPVGTGPFRVRRWERGSSIAFEANPHYWRGRPKLDRIEYQPVPNENTIVTLLRAHEVDLEFKGAKSYYEQLKSIPGTRAVLTDFNEYSMLAINTRSPLLNDVRVRKALWYALDVPGLLQRVSHGVDIAGYTDQPATSWAYNPDIVHYAYDPAKAMRLLAEAGWLPGTDGVRVKGGRPLAVTIAGVAGGATGAAVAVQLQAYWKRVGVAAQVKTYPSSLLFASYGAGGILRTGKYDVSLQSSVGGTDPDDASQWTCDQIPPRGDNFFFFCDQGLDAAERVATTTYDEAARKRAYAQVQAILADRVPMIPMWYSRRISVQNTDLRNFRPAHAVTSFWNPWEWQI
jgi:peptide/nickel transport system substrate-binding protein